MILKCSSILGVVFSRRMLLYLLQSDSQRKVEEAIATLFRIKVLECEGGDFTNETSYVMVHHAPSRTRSLGAPHCACLGTRAPPTSRDLPHYAFCGYMRFRHPLFRTTTYELLTEVQKQDWHERALMYLERYTRRCVNCGAGCFIKLLGTRIDDGLHQESKEMRNMRQQITALSNEAKAFGDDGQASAQHIHSEFALQSLTNIPGSSYFTSNQDLTQVHRSLKTGAKAQTVRSFSSIALDECECWAILFSAYDQLINHCRGAVQLKKLFEGYLEYADLSVMRFNIPQAMRLLDEVEQLFKSEQFCQIEFCESKWYTDYLQGRIATLRGWSIFAQGDVMEAITHLLHALKLYHVPFPNSE